MAIFKESKQSLRWFLIIIGVTGLYYSITELMLFKQLSLVDLSALVVDGILGLATLYIGVLFNQLVQTKTVLLVRFFWFSIIWTIINATYIYFSGLLTTGTSIFYGIGIFIDFVIISNIDRLAKENV